MGKELLKFFDGIFDPLTLFKSLKNSKAPENQYIKSGDIRLKLYPNKMEIKMGNLGGDPFNMSLAGTVRFGNSGEIVMTPSFSILYSLLTAPFKLAGVNLVSRTLKWDPHQIIFEGKVISKLVNGKWEKQEEKKED